MHRIKIEAEKARAIFEQHSIDISHTFFGGFPRGACGNASDFLAYWLKKQGVTGVEYVNGYRGEQSHGWLEHDGYIIDITADQFDEISERVYFSQNRNFHNSFTEQHRSEPSVSPILGDSLNRFLELMEAGIT